MIIINTSYDIDHPMLQGCANRTYEQEGKQGKRGTTKNLYNCQQPTTPWFLVFCYWNIVSLVHGLSCEYSYGSKVMSK